MAKKRANGEGNIRKRKDGRWEGRYTAGYDEKTGKRLIKNVLGKTQAEVKEKLAKAVAEVESVDIRRADEYTLGTWLQTWYEDVKIVSSMLGHFDAGFTLRTYTHVTRQMQESAAEKMGNFMAQVM